MPTFLLLLCCALFYSPAKELQNGWPVKRDRLRRAHACTPTCRNALRHALTETHRYCLSQLLQKCAFWQDFSSCMACLQGMKTVVTVNEWDLVTKYAAEAKGFNEIWVNYADDEPPLRAKHPGDPRAALTPWLAHKVNLLTLPCPCWALLLTAYCMHAYRGSL